MCARRKSAADKKKIVLSDDFYSDLDAGDMIHAVLVRSPFSYGTVTSIGFAPKTEVPDGYALLTRRELGAVKNTVMILGTEIPFLCEGKIAYKGEPLALLVGGDRKILEELKTSVIIQIDRTGIKETESKFSKAYGSLSVSLKDGLPLEQSVLSLRNTLEHFSKTREIVAQRKIIAGDTKAILADSERTEHIVEGAWSSSISLRTNKETEGCLCQIKSGSLHIFTPSQWVSRTIETVAEATGFPKDRIFITRTKISSESTGLLWQNGILAALAALAAISTGKAVRLSLSRDEQRNFIETPPQIKINHRTALDKNGVITAMEISIDYDAGAYNPFAREILDRLSLTACGIYSCRNVKISARAYRSHNPPSSQPLAMIDSQSFFAMENQIQRIAEKTGLSPVELRQMNKAGGLRKATAPFTFSFGRASDAINAVAIRSDFKRKHAVARLAEHGRLDAESNAPYSPPLRGIGLSCAFEGSGFLGGDFGRTSVSLQVSVTEEKKIIVHALPQSQAVREIWTKIITDTLETDKRGIIFASDDSEEQTARKSRQTQIPERLVGDVSVRTALLKKCADSIRRKKLDDAPFSVRKSIPASRKSLWNQEEFTGTPFYNTSFGTCTVELELDTCTFREKLRRICVIIDGGRILNPKAAENAVNRAIERCLASLVEGDSLKCPAVSVQFMQSEEEPKQIGRLIYSLLPAAYTSALSQAVAVTVPCLPLETDSLFKYAENNKTAENSAAEDEK